MDEGQFRYGGETLNTLGARSRRYRIFTRLIDLDQVAARRYPDNDAHDSIGRSERRAVRMRNGAIRLLCMPRVLDYVFNPLSVYYCHDRTGRLAALHSEVNNTFGQHAYVFPVSTSGGSKPDHDGDDTNTLADRAASPAGVIKPGIHKCFHALPFLDMDMRYGLRLMPPADTLSLSIRTVSSKQVS